MPRNRNVIKRNTISRPQFLPPDEYRIGIRRLIFKILGRFSLCVVRLIHGDSPLMNSGDLVERHPQYAASSWSPIREVYNGTDSLGIRQRDERIVNPLTSRIRAEHKHKDPEISRVCGVYALTIHYFTARLTIISTRRLFARPSTLLLSEIGRSSPMPFASTRFPG